MPDDAAQPCIIDYARPRHRRKPRGIWDACRDAFRPPVWVALIVSSCCLAVAAVVPPTYTSTAMVRVSPIVAKVSIPLDIPGPPSLALMNAIATQPRFPAGVTADVQGELLFIRSTAPNVGTAQRGATAAATAVMNARLPGNPAATPFEQGQYRLSLMSSGDRPLRPDPTGRPYRVAAALAAGAGLIMFIVALLRLLIRAGQDDARSAVEGLLGGPPRVDGLA